MLGSPVTAPPHPAGPLGLLLLRQEPPTLEPPGSLHAGRSGAGTWEVVFLPFSGARRQGAAFAFPLWLANASRSALSVPERGTT